MESFFMKAKTLPQYSKGAAMDKYSVTITIRVYENIGEEMIFWAGNTNGIDYFGPV